MIIYSQKIVLFIKEIKKVLREVLSKEIGVNVSKNCFYDKYQMNSYPINLVIFNTKSMLGYFDSTFSELGFNECLMHSSKEQLRDVIRHELAHYMMFIKHGTTIYPHGVEFKMFCEKIGWGENVYQPSTCLKGPQNSSIIDESGIFRKVQKLMALATSSNKNEAEQAMIKSQQLLLKHNLESSDIGGADDEKMYLKRIMKQKKKDGKMRAISRILATFFVSVVYSRGGDYTYLEILGSSVNVEIAEYVAKVLDSELDNLWNQAQKNADLRGTVAKNSFFLGLAKGYCDKIHALKREHHHEMTNALMVIEKKLIDAQEMAYGRLSKSTSSASYCGYSSALGEQMGKKLNINPAVSRSQNSEFLLPSFP